MSSFQYLTTYIDEKLTPEQKSWLTAVIADFKKSKEEGNFLYQFSLCSRKLKNKEGLFFCGLEFPHFNLIEITRIYLLLSYCQIAQKKFDEIYQKLRVTADLHETITLYKGLSFFPPSTALNRSAEEGLRSNMKEVFEAVALDNLYPAKYFDENSWNQMVLKALFVESPIYRIIGFNKRKNDNLNRMVQDYALERIAASRSISPELWRCMNSTENPKIIDFWLKTLKEGSNLEKGAICLVWADQISPSNQKSIENFLKNNTIYTWDQIGLELFNQRKGIS